MRISKYTKFGIIPSLILSFVLLQSEVFAQTEEETASENSASVAAETSLDDASEASEEIDLDRVFQGKDSPSLIHLRAMQEHFQELVEQVRPATVGIKLADAQGSGVIVSRDGYVLTAAHVIGRPDQKATVILPDGRELEAKTLGLDHSIDSGMLKIVQEGKWPYLEIGESESLNSGQWVMALGHPGGFDSERQPPIRVGRVINNRNERALQTDCTLVGGDSGGPLVDMDGNVIGIHSRIGAQLQQNYHVPIDTYLINWDDMVAKKETGARRPSMLRRPAYPVYLGLSFVEGKLELSSVNEDGPAGKAGLKVGDEVIEFNGKKISDQASFRRELVRLKPNDSVKIVVQRGDERIELEMTAGPPRAR